MATILFPSGLDTNSNTNVRVTSVDSMIGTDLVKGGPAVIDKIYTELEALETKIGINSSTDKTSIDYKLSGIPTNDKAASLTGFETLKSKIITLSTISQSTALDANADPNFTYYGLARQALINSNFKYWQRNTTFTNPSNATYTADRWRFNFVNTGTLPTSLVHSKQQLNSGDILGSFYYYRLTTNGAGSSIGTSDIYQIAQPIENGVRLLCNNANQFVTISFYARSSIASKRLGVYINQNYGTGGSPSTNQIVNGSFITLTSSWTRYTVSIQTKSIIGNIFGTNNDDALELTFAYAWGATTSTRVGASNLETFGGSGTIDIAQVILNSGNIALPYQPKDPGLELLECQRYYETSYNLLVSLGSTDSSASENRYSPTTFLLSDQFIRYKVRKRIINNNITIYSYHLGTVGSTSEYSSVSAYVAERLVNIPEYNDTGFTIVSNGGVFTAGSYQKFNWTIDSEMY